MNEESLVSVIIPFYNSEKFIEETIRSVFAQTYSNWELLLVDDGSIDNSTNIALDYAKWYPGKVYYFEHDRHENRGTSATRNLGIKNATGKYIALLDSDDIWVPNKLQEQVNILDRNSEIGMVYGDTKHWYSWTGDPDDSQRDYYIHEKMHPNTLTLNTLIQPPVLLILALNGKIWIPQTSNIMLRKNVLDEVGGFEESFTGMHDDHALLAKIFLNSSVYVADTCWDLYRQHPDSCFNTALNKGQWTSAELYYLDWLDQYLKYNRIKIPNLLNALHNRIWKYKHPTLFNLSVLWRKITHKILKEARSLIDKATNNQNAL